MASVMSVQLLLISTLIAMLRQPWNKLWNKIKTISYCLLFLSSFDLNTGQSSIPFASKIDFRNKTSPFPHALIYHVDQFYSLDAMIQI
jgi:hypothetical protein